jgi:hypothetical protein
MKAAIKRILLNSEYVFSSRGKAVIDNATTRGFTKPQNNILQTLDSQLLKPMSDSLWGKIKGLRVFSYNNNGVSDFSRLNLKDPANNLATINGGLTYSYGGWTGNGVDGWMNQNYNPVTAANGYTQDSAFQAFFVRKRSEGANNALAGQITATTTQIRNAVSINQRLNSGGDLSAARDLSNEGFKLINRPDASNLNTYDDLVKTDIARTSFTLPNENMTLFRFGSGYGDMELSFNAWGSSLTESEANELRNLFNNYYKAIWDFNMSGVLNVYYLAGQSNATGRAVNSSIAPELNGAVGAKIYALAPGPFPGTITSASEFAELTLGGNQTTEQPLLNHGVEMRFGYDMFQNASEDVAIIKFGIGGTSMAVTWSVGGSGNTTIRRIVSNYSITDIWDTLRLRVVPRGLIWIQGESDCVGGLGAAYEASYKAMIKDFLDRCNNSGIKTDKLRWFTFQTKNGGSAGYDPTDYANVIAGQAGAMDEFLIDNPTYANRIKSLTYQSTDDIPLLDTQHYSTIGIDTMGTRLYDYFSQYINE